MASTPFERVERTATRLGPLVGLILLLAAIWAVHRTLHGAHWREVQHQLASLGAGGGPRPEG